MLSREALMTITPDDILQSSVFAEDREPEDDDESPLSARCERRHVGRSIILGVVGDSAAGKTTLTRGLVRVLGEDNVTHVCVDDYHRYDRRQRAERNITPLHPDCNYMDIMAQHLAHMRDGEPFLKPVYQHKDGTFGPLVRVDPKRFSVVEGLLGYYTEELRSPLRRARSTWRRPRSCAAGGRCSATARAAATRPTRCSPSSTGASPTPRRSSGRSSSYADIVVSFLPNAGGDQEHLDARARAPPDAASIPTSARCSTARPTARAASGSPSRRRAASSTSRAGSTASAAEAIEEMIWASLHFASHLRSERLGEFTIGTDLHRSESLALIQLLILYHLFTATATPRSTARRALRGETSAAPRRGRAVRRA